MASSAKPEHWSPEVVDGEVVIDRELTDPERIDRLELIVDELSLRIAATHGARSRATAAVRHLLKQRGWLRVG